MNQQDQSFWKSKESPIFAETPAPPTLKSLKTIHWGLSPQMIEQAHVALKMNEGLGNPNNIAGLQMLNTYEGF